MLTTGCYTYSYDINADGYTTNHEHIVKIIKVSNCFITYHTIENRKPTRVKVKDDTIKMNGWKYIPLKKMVKIDDKVFDESVENLELWNEMSHSRTWTDEKFINFVSQIDDRDIRIEYIKFNRKRFNDEEDFQSALN